MTLSRRRLLNLIGCSAAASPFLTPVSFAAGPWDNRLVVIILRGALDGLDAVQPYGDPAWPELRRTLAGGPEIGSPDLDGFFALHPAMRPLMPMWAAGDLGFVHAVSTPYRDKRSHFDGQDLLEAGTMSLAEGARDGWLNRLLQTVPGVSGDTAYAIGRGDMYLLRGSAPVANWSAEADLTLSPQALRLMELVMQDDPKMHAVLQEAELLAGADVDAGGKRRPGHIRTAAFAAERLRSDARIAAFSLNGWDTHQDQHRALPKALERLADVLLTLKEELTGPVWNKTGVVVMTEFGRTARENGTRGTDHGTGGVMIYAGGALRGGQVGGAWPGLGQAELYQGRDLEPTRDVRAYAAWIMRGLFSLDATTLETKVFPGVDLGDDPRMMR
ncbi:DUF1501 domain-containing protein [Aliishimia ponticola]|uniref:DUF1501 domain-containing protein n=1 Tax=Aliishimia ponticola TaxID=2499833 RepID=A0A4S4NB79_9RHOB|nr:DUF1501 domain-containing protein [Aliishimia ponticola]THH36569.1 DUF1501 domain-containing protein [Aliishimia ponticola]